MATGGNFIKKITHVTYSRNSKVMYILKPLYGNILAMNGRAYFARTVSYSRKMFMKLTKMFSSNEATSGAWMQVLLVPML